MGALLETSPVVTADTDFPELVVEVNFLFGPSASGGGWCDISRFVSQGNTTRGRRYETDRFESGTLNLTLRVDPRQFPGRLFDQEWAAGPFYPYLKPMRAIRVSAVWSGVYYPVWYGYVTSWGSVTTAADSCMETSVTARDAFLRLEQIKLPSSAWALEVQKDDPSLWFRLGETDTARVTDSSDGGNYGIYDNVDQGVEGLVVNDSDAAISVESGGDQRVVIQNPSLIAGFPFTVSAMVSTTAQPDGVRNPVIFHGRSNLTQNGPRMGIIVGLTSGSAIGFIDDGAGNQRNQKTDTPICDGRPHHLMWVATNSSTYLMYLDGVLQTSAATTGGTGTPSYFGTSPNGYTIGNMTDVTWGDFGFDGVIDEVCVWDGLSLDADRAAAHSLAALDGWDGDDSGARAERFLDAIGWPETLRDIDTGISVLGPASWSSGSSALSVLQAWADTELGAFFIGKSGEITWRSRHYPLLDANATTSQATFGDAAGDALQYLARGFSMPRDENLLRNPVTASRTNGVSVTVRDTANIEEFGDRTWALPNSEDQLDSAIRDRALWGLAKFKDPKTRLESMMLAPRKTTAMWPEALGRELGDRITIERTPLDTGDETTFDQIIERIEHQFAPKFWETKVVGSPVDPNVGDYLILDDAVFGLLDTGLLAY